MAPTKKTARATRSTPATSARKTGRPKGSVTVSPSQITSPRTLRSSAKEPVTSATPIRKSTHRPIAANKPEPNSVVAVKKRSAPQQSARKPSKLSQDEVNAIRGVIQPEISAKVSTSKKRDKDADVDGSRPSFWLMKAEPESRIENGVDVKFSIDDLAAASEPVAWDGVRNYSARNNLRRMKKGDMAFFYHSNCKVPGIVGRMEITGEHSVDETAFNPEHPYYDKSSTRDNPKWSVVHVQFLEKFPVIITLKELRSFAKPGGVLEGMQMLVQSRLSVSQILKKEWDFILELATEEAAAASAQHQPNMVA